MLPEDDPMADPTTDPEGWRWAIGTGVTVIAFLVTSLTAMYRNLSTKITKTHERIDDVKDKYVRRDDLDMRLAPLNDQITQLRSELKDYNERVIDAITHINS